MEHYGRRHAADAADVTGGFLPITEDNVGRYDTMKRLIPVALAMALVLALGHGEVWAQRCGGGGCGGGSGGGSGGGTLTAAEASWILRMREEEKLARDVYLTLNAIWNAPIFSQIAQQENCHTTAVRQLIVNYGLVDPVVDDSVGAFTNPLFTELYHEFVAAGSVSLPDAYQVGVDIEELDIADLLQALGVVSKTDIRSVFQKLLKGSYNHLAAFQSHL